MGDFDLENSVAVLSDWRNDHTAEHKTLWEKVDANFDQHIDFIKAIERIETKLAIYTSIGVAVGSLLGSVIGALITHILSGAK